MNFNDFVELFGVVRYIDRLPVNKPLELALLVAFVRVKTVVESRIALLRLALEIGSTRRGRYKYKIKSRLAQDKHKT